MMDMQIGRPARFLAWARETFGDVALDPHERMLRFLEEAVELAHSLNIDMERTCAVVARVYARPPGTSDRELGQCLATLELLAEVLGIDAGAEAAREFQRVQGIPKEEWAKRHSAKVALGIAR